MGRCEGERGHACANDRRVVVVAATAAEANLPSHLCKRRRLPLDHT